MVRNGAKFNGLVTWSGMAPSGEEINSMVYGD